MFNKKKKWIAGSPINLFLGFMMIKILFYCLLMSMIILKDQGHMADSYTVEYIKQIAYMTTLEMWGIIIHYLYPVVYNIICILKKKLKKN